MGLWWLIGTTGLAIAVVAVRDRRAGARGAPLPDRTMRLRTIVPRTDDPFRTNGGLQHELPAERAAEPRPIEDVIATLRASGLAPTATRNGFDLPGTAPHQYVRVVALDRRRVIPNELMLVTNEGETAIDLAFALLPLFGPIAVAFMHEAWIIVDGSRDRASLRGLALAHTQTS